MFYLPSLIVIAFLGGLLSIASPCSGLLIPLYFGHTFKTKEKFLLNSLLFFIGSYLASFLITIGIYYIFVSLPYAVTLYKIAGFLFIILGIFTLFGKTISIPLPKINKINDKKLFSSLLLGVFAAFSHGGCCGPVLGLIATNVARLNNLFLAAFVILFYTIGITLPFLLIALGIDKLNFLKKVFVKGKVFKFSLLGINIVLHSSNLISAVLFILSGLMLVIFNGSVMQALGFLRIDLNFMLQYQDSLINFFINK